MSRRQQIVGLIAVAASAVTLAVSSPASSGTSADLADPTLADRRLEQAGCGRQRPDRCRRPRRRRRDGGHRPASGPRRRLPDGRRHRRCRRHRRDRRSHGGGLHVGPGHPGWRRFAGGPVGGCPGRRVGLHDRGHAQRHRRLRRRPIVLRHGLGRRVRGPDPGQRERGAGPAPATDRRPAGRRHGHRDGGRRPGGRGPRRWRGPHRDPRAGVLRRPLRQRDGPVDRFRRRHPPGRPGPGADPGRQCRCRHARHDGHHRRRRALRGDDRQQRPR